MTNQGSNSNRTDANQNDRNGTSSNDANTTVDQLRVAMQNFVNERNWNRFHTPKNLAGSVSIEAAELLELFQWMTSEEATERAMSDEKLRGDIADEMSDVFLYLLSMANALDIDLAKSTFAKIEKNNRKYPVENAHQFKA